MIYILGFIYCSAVVFFFIRSLKADSELELFPSIVWLLLMTGPFVFFHNSLSEKYLTPQVIGIFSVGFSLLLADAVNIKGPNLSSQLLKLNSNKKLLRLAFCFVSVSLVLQAKHILMMPEVPLLVQLFGNASDTTNLAVLRENSSKLLNAPVWFIYLCQVTITVLIPIAMVLFINFKKYVWALVSFVLGAIYSKVTLAKGPLVLLLVLTAMILWVLLSPSLKKKILVFVAVAMSIAVGILLVHPKSVTKHRSSKEEIHRNSSVQAYKISDGSTVIHPFTIGDSFRVIYSDPDYYNHTANWFQRLHYYFYRSVLVPMEVAHRWYVYFPAVEGKFLGFYGLSRESRNSPDFQHPANKVAIWAYTKRFPESYLDSARAYTSTDADAWSRWGYWGLLLATLAVAALRILLKFLRPAGFIGDCLYAFTLIILAVSLPAASLQAMLVAQGLGVYILIFVLMHIWRRSGSTNKS